MVLEAIINPFKAKRHPGWLFFVGILFAIIAVLFSLWVFQSQASLIMVLLVVLISVPLLYSATVIEEEEDIKLKSEGSILKEHAKTIGFLTLLFIGFVVGFTLIYIFLPTETVGTLFSTQHAAISNVNQEISGASVQFSSFLGILGNNLKVLVFCVVFALFFGAGAIFILAWNASVIAAAIGTYIRDGLAAVASSFGLLNIANYFTIVVSGFLRYLTHGVFEIAAYFIGGLAGGILSVALIRHRHEWKGPAFGRVLWDVVILLIVSIVILLFAALVEVGITPLLF